MTILKTGFGWVETDAGRFEHDILVFPDGRIENRYDKLTGSNHRLDPAEAATALDGTHADFVFGTGQYGTAVVAEETEQLLAGLEVRLHALPTPEAAGVYNRLSNPKCGVFHVTC